MMELLSPAGGYDALVAAVQSGADAVYMGFGAFNARRSAKNFTDEDFAAAGRYCHLRGVRVFLTLNTLVTDRELPQAAEALRNASRMGVDAVLVQDWGLLTLAQELVPDLPIHASTQMSLFTLGGANEAAALGMENTHFANPNGLDDEGHYSTAYDMALLACAAVNEPTLRRIAATRTAVIGGRTLTNHNKLLGRVDGCIGLKTGYTKAAGRTLVSCAQREGCRLVAVTLRDGDDWNDHETLYRYGFALAAVRRELYARFLRALDNTGGATP